MNDMLLKNNEEKEENGGNNMNDFSTQDILTGRGLNLYGFGGGYSPGYYGAGYGYGPYATPTGIAHQLNGSRDLLRTIGNQITDQNEETRRILQNDQQTAYLTTGFNRVCDKLISMDLNNLRESSDLSRQISECCCNTQLGIKDVLAAVEKSICETRLDGNKNTSTILSAIADLKTSNIQRDLDVAQARVTQLETINAITKSCGCCNGHGPGNG